MGETRTLAGAKVAIQNLPKEHLVPEQDPLAKITVHEFFQRELDELVDRHEALKLAQSRLPANLASMTMRDAHNLGFEVNTWNIKRDR